MYVCTCMHIRTCTCKLPLLGSTKGPQFVRGGGGEGGMDKASMSGEQRTQSQGMQQQTLHGTQCFKSLHTQCAHAPDRRQRCMCCIPQRTSPAEVGPDWCTPPLGWQRRSCDCHMTRRSSRTESDELFPLRL